MDVRVLTDGDAADYFDLRLDGLRREPTAFGTSASEYALRPLSAVRARLLPDPDSVTVGAFVEGDLVGVATLVRSEALKTRHKASVVAVYVAPHVRGRGVGRAVLSRVLDHARKAEGLDQLTLAVSATQTAARALYVSLGFVPFGLEPRALRVEGQDVDEEHMVLFLHSS